MTNQWEIGGNGPEKPIVDSFLERMKSFQNDLAVAGSTYPQLAYDFQALHMQVENLIGEIQRSRGASVGEFDNYMNGKRMNGQEWTGF